MMSEQRSEEERELINAVVLLGSMMATEVRARILLELRDPTGATRVTDLAETLDICISSVSHHLSILHSAKVVRVESYGREKFVSLELAYRRPLVKLFSELVAAIEGEGEGDEDDDT